MCAIISGALGNWSNGEETVRRAYRELGHRTGASMISSGVVAAGAGIEEYGAVSEQIMDTCGLEGWTRLETADTHHTVVPGCARYVDVFGQIGAPPQLCAIPFEWDNGCLDVINANLEIQPERCAYAGSTECHYVIRAARSAQRADRGRAVGGVAVKDDPGWTNPNAGLYAIIGRCMQALPAPHDALSTSLKSLGSVTAQQFIQRNLLVPGDDARRFAEVFAAIAQVSGFGNIWLEGDGTSARVTLEDPYEDVLDHFGNRDQILHIAYQWEHSWITHIDPSLELTVDWSQPHQVVATIVRRESSAPDA
jgi:hypothetical protein